MSKDDPADLDGKHFVYALHDSSYEDSEVISIHATAEGAEAKNEEHGGCYCVLRRELLP